MDSLFFVVHVPRALVLVRERRQRGDQREHVHRVQLLVCGRCGAYDGPGGLLFCRDRFVPFDVFVDAGDVHEDFEQNGRGGEREGGGGCVFTSISTQYNDVGCWKTKKTHTRTIMYYKFLVAWNFRCVDVSIRP